MQSMHRRETRVSGKASESREIARRDFGGSPDTTRRARRARSEGATRRSGCRRRRLTRRGAEATEEIAQRRGIVLRRPDLHRRRLLRLPLLLL